MRTMRLKWNSLRIRKWLLAATGFERARVSRNLYLDLLEKTLTGIILQDSGYLPTWTPSRPDGYNEEYRTMGLDWPVHAHTMIGLRRLRHLRECVSSVLKDKVPGDFIETGVWRGGACIYMRALLAVRGITDRKVWVADSFEGLPAPNAAKYPADVNDRLHTVEMLAVSLEEVQSNFQQYNLLDDQVVFLKGFFEHTLESAPIQKLAILRLDGDMYQSTTESFEALYDKVSAGGYVIVDDYSLKNCRSAVDDFRSRRNITDAIQSIDGNASFWRKAS